MEGGEGVEAPPSAVLRIRCRGGKGGGWGWRRSAWAKEERRCTSALASSSFASSPFAAAQPSAAEPSSALAAAQPYVVGDKSSQPSPSPSPAEVARSAIRSAGR